MSFERDVAAFRRSVGRTPAPAVPKRVSRQALTTADIDWLMEVVGNCVKKFVEQELAPLRSKLAEIEKRQANWKYVGAYRAGGVMYVEGNFCTWDGGLWACRKDTTARPGTSSDWQLCVKSGRDR